MQCEHIKHFPLFSSQQKRNTMDVSSGELGSALRLPSPPRGPWTLPRQLHPEATISGRCRLQPQTERVGRFTLRASASWCKPRDTLHAFIPMLEPCTRLQSGFLLDASRAVSECVTRRNPDGTSSITHETRDASSVKRRWRRADLHPVNLS